MHDAGDGQVGVEDDQVGVRPRTQHARAGEPVQGGGGGGGGTTSLTTGRVGGIGGTGGTAAEVSMDLEGLCKDGFCATCCAARSCFVSAPTDILLRLSRISTGAVRLRRGILRSDSRFFRAIVGGMMAS